MTNILVPDFIKILLIFLRILGVFISAPIFGSESLPNLVKVLFSAFIAYITFLSVDTTKIPVETELLPLGIIGIKEILTGLIIGYSLNMIFYGVSFAGYLIGHNMGLSMATAFNPAMESEENVIGEVINFAALLIFIIINGHHYLISASVASFKVIPIGKFTITEPVFQLLTKYTGFVFIIAVKIAAPVIVSYFLLVLAEGIIARVIPQMHIFFVAQPLLTIIGYSLLITALPVYVYFLRNLLKNCEMDLYNLIKAMGS